MSTFPKSDSNYSNTPRSLLGVGARLERRGMRGADHHSQFTWRHLGNRVCACAFARGDDASERPQIPLMRTYETFPYPRKYCSVAKSGRLIQIKYR